MYGAYTHRASRDYDSELVQTGSVFEHANEGAVVAGPLTSLSDEDVGQGFFEEAFQPRYNYPSPAAVDYDNDFPYPTLVPESELESSTSGFSGSVDVDVAQGHGHRPELGVVPTFLPSQSTTGSERNSRPSIDHGGDDSGLGRSIAPSTPMSVASKKRRVVAQTSPGLDPRLAGAQEEVPHTTNLFPDETSPYVHGNVDDRQQGLRDLMEDIQAAVASHGQAADLRFVCEHCGHESSNKHGLDHHVRIHNPSWKRKFICPQCGMGFPYPSKVTRHVESVHDEVKKHTCTDCDKAYARKDGLQRHLRDEGHTTPGIDAPSSSSTVSRQRSHPSSRANPRASTRRRLPSGSSIRPAARKARVNPETSNQVDQLLHPPYPRALPSLPTSSTMTSADDTISTVSDVDSFLR